MDLFEIELFGHLTVYNRMIDVQLNCKFQIAILENV